MHFRSSEVQTQLQAGARQLFAKELSPELIPEIEQSEAGFSGAIWCEGVQLGWPGTTLPEAFGGSDCSLLDMCVLIEEPGPGGAALPPGRQLGCVGNTPQQGSNVTAALLI